VRDVATFGQSVGASDRARRPGRAAAPGKGLRDWVLEAVSSESCDGEAVVGGVVWD
jgi:hypothetical protein